MWKFVGSVSSVPTGCAVRLAVLDKDGLHALAFACCRIEDYWVHAETKAKVDVHPTHWHEWPEQ
jgi:hypothetical protein